MIFLGQLERLLFLLLFFCKSVYMGDSSTGVEINGNIRDFQLIEGWRVFMGSHEGLTDLILEILS